MARMTVYHGGYTPVKNPELDFIIDCRSGKEHAYDIVIGAMADDQIYNHVSDYMDGSITREQLTHLLALKLMIITAVCIMKIHRIYWNVIWKIR